MATPDTPDTGAIELIPITRRLLNYLHNKPPLATTTSEPNQPTTTFQEEEYEEEETEKKLHGLHVDRHFWTPAAELLNSPRRISRNDGPGDRWLLLGSIDAIAMTELLGYPPEHVPTALDLREYVANPNRHDGPPFRCLWIPVPRNTAYIGPTEVMFHDGSTFTMPGPSTIRFWMTQLKRGQLGSIY